MREVFELLSTKIREDACEEFGKSVDAYLAGLPSAEQSDSSTKLSVVTRTAADQIRVSGGLLMEALTDVHIAEGIRDLDSRADDLRAMYAREMSALSAQLTRCRDARIPELVDPKEERAFVPNFNSAIQKMEEDAEKKIRKLIEDARSAKRLNGMSSSFGLD